MRHALPVPAHLRAEVVVVDEALAVGDELFQKKCYAHLERLKEQGTAVLLVTHNCPQIIQHCDQALLLHRGKARMLDEPARVTTTYQRLINASDADWDAAFPAEVFEASQVPVVPQTTSLESAALTEPAGSCWFDPHLVPQSTEIYPSHGGRISDLWIEALDSQQRVNVLPFGEAFALVFSYVAEQPLDQVVLACHIASHTGQRITGQSLPPSAGPQPGGHITHLPAGSQWQVRFQFSGGLWPGLYFIGGGILSYAGQERRFIHRVVDFRALRVLDEQPIQAIGACSLQAAAAELTLRP